MALPATVALWLVRDTHDSAAISFFFYDQKQREFRETSAKVQ